MKWHALGLVCATFCAFSLAKSVKEYASDLYDTAVDFGADKIKSFLNETAYDLIQKSPFNFLNQYELDNLRHIILQYDLEELAEIQKKKLFRVGVMKRVFDAIYDYDYKCKTNESNLTLTFNTARRNVTLPDKWILDFFNVTSKRVV